MSVEQKEQKKEIKRPLPDTGINIEEESDASILNGFECSITREIMQDPVIAADGHSYERAAIEAWFKSGKHTSPLTGTKLVHRTLMPNISLKKAIQDFVEKRLIRQRKEQELADRSQKIILQEAKLNHQPIVSKPHQKLLRAAARGDVKTVDQLLATEVDVDAGIKQSGWTPLFAATRAPNAQVFNRLMDAKADAHITIQGYTLAQQVALVCRWSPTEKHDALKRLATSGVSLSPIHEAASLGDEKAVVAEVKKGQGNVKDAQQNSVLHYVAANGRTDLLPRFIKTDAILLKWIRERDLETAEWLLREGGIPVEEVNREGNTALLLAADNGQLETVQWLLREGGAKITEQDKNGNTVLLVAAKNDQLETVQWLLREGGAKITEQNKNGDTALLRAAFNGQLTTVQWLLREGGAKITEQNKNGDTALLRAAFNGQLETVQWLLREGGAKITEQDKKGNTALLLAAYHGQLGTVQWLLREGGAKITEQNEFGATALLMAAYNGHLETMKWLLSEEGGANISEQDQYGITALLREASNGHLETVQWLLRESGAKITEQNKNGTTALLAAASTGQLETVQWLLREGGAKITEQNELGATALLGAVYNGHLEMVQWLLCEGGAKITEKNNQGQSVFDLANTEEIRTFLKDFKANLHAPGQPGLFGVSESKSRVPVSPTIPSSSSSSSSSADLTSSSSSSNQFGLPPV